MEANNGVTVETSMRLNRHVCNSVLALSRMNDVPETASETVARLINSYLGGLDTDTKRMYQAYLKVLEN